jgi:hypothetical protein
MPANECIPYYEPGTRITGHATATVVGKTIADVSGNFQSGPLLSATSEGGNIQVATCAAGVRGIGVFGYDGVSGDKIPLITGPGIVAPVTAGATITAGQEVEVGSAGKVIPLASGRPVGKALSGASANADCPIRLY